MKLIAKVAAVLSFVFCLGGGLWLLFQGASESDSTGIGIGLYFIGKAFFVGPMLLIAARQIPSAEPGGEG